MTRLRWRGGEAELHLDIEQARTKAAAVSTRTTAATSSDDTDRIGSLRRDLLATAQQAPVAAIESAWRLVETKLRELVPDAGAGMGVRSSEPSTWAQFLVGQGALPDGTPEVVDALASTRDRALRLQFVESEHDAASFVEACLYLYGDLLAIDPSLIRGRLHPS